MKHLVFLLLQILSIDALGCQNPPQQNKETDNEFRTQISIDVTPHFENFVVEVAVPVEFDDYNLTDIRLYQHDANDLDTLIVNLAIEEGYYIRTYVNKSVLPLLVFGISYGDCGYRFNLTGNEVLAIGYNKPL